MMRSPSSLVKPILYSVLGGVVLYGAAVLATDVQTVWWAASRVGLPGWCVILGLSLANYGLRFARWRCYLVSLGHTIPIGRSCAYYLGGFAFTTTPVKAGEAVRSLYLKRHGVSYADSLAALFAERLVDVAAMLLLALAAALAFPTTRWVVALLGVLAIVLMAVLHNEALGRRLARRGSTIRHRGVRRLVRELLVLLGSAASLLRGASLGGGLLIGIAAWAAEGIGLHVVLVALEIPSSLSISLGIYALSVLIGALSFIPGGLGSTEAAMGLLLVWHGADPASAVAATLMCRLATLWFAVAIGVVAVLILGIGEQGGGHPYADPASSSPPQRS